MEEYFRRTQNSWCVQRGRFFAEKERRSKISNFDCAIFNLVAGYDQVHRENGICRGFWTDRAVVNARNRNLKWLAKALIYLFGIQRIELSRLEKYIAGMEIFNLLAIESPG